MSSSLRRTSGNDASTRTAAESWFLERGLPAVLTRRARWRRLWSRSAPMLAAFATFHVCALGLYLVTGNGRIEIHGRPTTVEWIALVIVGIAPPLMAIVGWLVSRLTDSRTRAVVSTIAVAVVIGVGSIGADATTLPTEVCIVAATLILTASGLGSVVGWAVRMMLSHLTTIGILAVRALPVVLLTALVFFNTYVWLMAATINGGRLGLAMAFLILIAGAFVISATIERVRPMLKSTATLPKDTERLADTPFAALPDPPPGSADAPLKKSERLNVVFVLAASQLAQILVVAVVTTGIYLVLGLIVLTPQLLNEWTHTYTSTATLLGWTVPVPDSLIHMCLFLGALTFMYISARAAGDAEYRSTFLDPLIDDLHATLIARNRYRAAVAVDTSDVDAIDVTD
jgi:hypothetical protein